MRRNAAVLTMAILAAAAAACAPSTQYIEPTMNTAADDLRAARDQRVITGREYDQQRDGELRR